MTPWAQISPLFCHSEPQKFFPKTIPLLRRISVLEPFANAGFGKCRTDSFTLSVILNGSYFSRRRIQYCEGSPASNRSGFNLWQVSHQSSLSALLSILWAWLHPCQSLNFRRLEVGDPSPNVLLLVLSDFIVQPSTLHFCFSPCAVKPTRIVVKTAPKRN